MTDRQRLDLRPTLDLDPGQHPEEQFQNTTLRPILRAQDAPLRAALDLFLGKRKVRLDQTPADQRFAKLKELITRDNRLRGLLFGMVVGLFTTEEFAYYTEHEAAVNRRITNLLVERLRA